MPPRRTRSSQVRLGFSPFWLPFPPPGPPPPPLPEADRACRRSLRGSGAPASGLSRSDAGAPAAASGRDEPKNDSPVWSPRGAPRPGTGTPLMGVDGASRASPFDGGRVGDGGGGEAGSVGRPPRADRSVPMETGTAGRCPSEERCERHLVDDLGEPWADASNRGQRPVAASARVRPRWTGPSAVGGVPGPVDRLGQLTPPGGHHQP